MKWINRKDLWKALLVMLTFTGLVAASPVLAAFEVSDFNMFSAPPKDTDSKWTGNIEIRWTAPTITSGYILQRYIYLWNNVSTKMSDTNFNGQTTGVVDAAKETAASKVGTDLTTKDFSRNPTDDVLHLHVKTEFLDILSNPNRVLYSEDAVLGAFRVDNVAPNDGSIRIVDSSGNTITSTSSSLLNVKLAASGTIGKYYLSESESSSGTGVSPFATDVAWNLQNTTAGSHTLYAWFEDPATNKSSKPSTTTFTLLGATSIKPYTATIDLAAATTQTFQVDGSTATDYVWTITDEKPDTTGDTVASISGSPGNSITVTALKKGTFKLRAVRTGEDLASGTFTVAQTSTTKTYNLITTSTTSVNAIVLSRSGTGYVKASDLFKAVPNCNDLSRWNATLQAYESYIPFANDFDLIVGEPYFVSVSAAGPFTVTGSVPTPSFTLKTTSTTSVNAISLPANKVSLTKALDLFSNIPNANDLSRWNATLQAYESYIPFANDFNLSVDEAYFVSVSAQTTWP
ncbi:MAG: hypothetical protein WCK00_00620 [Deltaproteobacteria bacterium]